MTNERLFDPIRQKWVSNTPEEKLRQRVLQWLLGSGGFSSHEILVEKALGVRLGFTSKSPRRFDIACVRFISTHEIEWLCLIECKAKIEDELSLQACYRQLEGYASHLPMKIQSLALASPEGCWYCETKASQKWLSGLPTRQSLLQSGA
jgi:hypothetical protein